MIKAGILEEKDNVYMITATALQKIADYCHIKKI